MGKASFFENEGAGMEVILSIIVPVYNVKEYLPKCLESLLDQDLSKDEYENCHYGAIKGEPSAFGLADESNHCLACEKTGKEG